MSQRPEDPSRLPLDEYLEWLATASDDDLLEEEVRALARRPERGAVVESLSALVADANDAARFADIIAGVEDWALAVELDAAGIDRAAMLVSRDTSSLVSDREIILDVDAGDDVRSGIGRTVLVTIAQGPGGWTVRAVGEPSSRPLAARLAVRTADGAWHVAAFTRDPHGVPIATVALAPVSTVLSLRVLVPG